MASKQIDLGWMRVFDEAVRRGSLSAAASALKMTQPAVSYQIRRIEGQLGFDILRRRNTGVELTVEGRALHEVVAKAVAGVDQLIDKREAQSSVRLRTDYAFASFWVVPRMQAFRRDHPDIDIQVVATQRPKLQDREDVDVSVIFGRADALEKGLTLLSEEVTPVCAPTLDEDQRLSASLSGLARSRLVHLDAEQPAPWLDWSAYFREVGVDRPAGAGHGDISFNTYSLVAEAVIAGQGVALGWGGLVDSYLKAGMLVRVGPAMRHEGRGYVLVAPKKPTKANAALVSWLRSEAGV